MKVSCRRNVNLGRISTRDRGSWVCFMLLFEVWPWFLIMFYVFHKCLNSLNVICSLLSLICYIFRIGTYEYDFVVFFLSVYVSMHAGLLVLMVDSNTINIVQFDALVVFFHSVHGSVLSVCLYDAVAGLFSGVHVYVFVRGFPIKLR